MLIAICVSGETRDHNSRWHDWLSDVKKCFDVEDGHIHFYGHTWIHSERPQSESIFKNLSITSQHEIENWVLQDPKKRHVKTGKEIPQDLQMQATKAAYGQLWSNHLCMKLVPLNRYDLVIRYRWDSGIHEDYERRFPLGPYEVKNNVEDALRIMNGKPAQLDPNWIEPDIKSCAPWVVASMPYKSNYLMDHVFILSKEAHREIVNENVTNMMEHLTDNAYDNPGQQLSSHAGWYRYFKHFNINVSVCLPPVWGRKFFDPKGKEEFAKQWGI